MKQRKAVLFWDKDKNPNGTYAEHTWLASDDVEVVHQASDNDDEKDNTIGILTTLLHFMKNISNIRLDEIIVSMEEIF